MRNELDVGAPQGDACNFAPRCWVRQALGNPERCMTERPELRESEEGHLSACHFEDQVPALAEAAIAGTAR